MTRMLHFVKTKTLPFSTTDVKRVVASCKICAEVKPVFFRQESGVLIKFTQSLERLSIDFKGPLPSSSVNKYLLIVVDEYFRFSFAFPCKDMTTWTVTNALIKFSPYVVNRRLCTLIMLVVSVLMNLKLI